MELTKGLVVRALAGRDMGNFFVVLVFKVVKGEVFNPVN